MRIGREGDIIEGYDEMIDLIYRYLTELDINRLTARHLKTLKYIGSAFARNLTFNNLIPFYDELSEIDDTNKLRASFKRELVIAIHKTKETIESSKNFNKDSGNSKNYYDNKIKELQLREIQLKRQLSSKSNKQKKITEELKLIEDELTKKQHELELKLKQDDAKNDWEQKIKNTFINLKNHLKPIQKEHDRLNLLYNWFAVLSIITLAIICIIEVSAIYKIISNEGFPDLKQYLTLFIPLPIAGALMWGFIFQMNRAQRQLLVIANNIHNVDYIQGLLISINNLSPDINDGILRINNALDKVISNHLKGKSTISEHELLEEEGKDKNSNIDVDKLATLIKTIKETVVHH